MLGKLLKYEIPALGRKLIPLYIAWAATAVLLGLMVGPIEGKSDFLEVISVLLYVAVATAVFVMAIIMIVQRYNNNLLGDGGYFAHSLPVTASQHIASKTISALIWVVLSMITMIITAFIIAAFSGSLKDILSFDWLYIFRDLDGDAWLIVLEFIILTILSSCKSILAIYAAITIGHQARQRTTLASIGAYIALMVFESTAGNIVIRLIPGMRLDLIDTRTGLQLTMLGGIIMVTVLGGLYFYICKDLMEKRLNLS